MKNRSTLGLLYALLLGGSLLGQSTPDFSAIDQHAQKAPKALFGDVNRLTEYLVEPANSELEKVRSIYCWITHHIDYDNEAYQLDKKRINRNIRDILKRRRAICFGYATLFNRMCGLAGVSSVVISGYSKGTLTARPNQSKPDHAWNAVKIDGRWHLLDATWGASVHSRSNDFVRINNESYFLTPPRTFILNHLPVVPMWQLLNCPIDYSTFQLPAGQLAAKIDTVRNCYNYRDSIERFLRLPLPERKLKAAELAYQFYPTEDNKREYGHSLVDYAGRLSDQLDRLSPEQDLDSLLYLQEKVIGIFRKAAPMIAFYNWQRELYINLLINHAVAIYRQSEELERKDERLKKYRAAIFHLEQSKELLEGLSPGAFSNYAGEKADYYLDFLKSTLKNLNG